MIKSYIKKIEDYIRNKVHNPLSTMSNIGYLWFGLLTMLFNVGLGIAQIILFVASSGFHWLRNDCWHRFDILAIFYVFGTLAGYLFAGDVGFVFGAGLAGIGHYLYDKGLVGSRQVIGVLGALTLIFFYIINGLNDTLFVLMWFALAFGVSSIADHFNPTQDGKWYDTFHGIWHIFSSIGIYYLAWGATTTVLKILLDI